MLPRLTPMYCNDGLNKKRWNVERTISTESIQKYTSINRNSMHMRDRKDIVTCYPKQHVIVLGQLVRVKSRLGSPSDRSSTKKHHDIISNRRVNVWIGRSTDKRLTKSLRYYFLSYPKLFTLNPRS